MLREILRATTENLQIKLPKNLINKTIEVLVFPVTDQRPLVKKEAVKTNDKRDMGFDLIKIPTKKWKFNRSEIYEK